MRSTWVFVLLLMATQTFESAQNQNDELFVADYGEHRVCVFSADGDTLLRSWDAYGSGDDMFLAPSALALAGSKLFLRDSSARRRVQVQCKHRLPARRRHSVTVMMFTTIHTFCTRCVHST